MLSWSGDGPEDFVLHGLMNRTLSWGKWEGFTISWEATIKLGGMFQGLKGRGMLVRWPASLSLTDVKSVSSVTLRTHLHHEAVMFLPYLQAALTTSPNHQSSQLPSPLPTYIMCPSIKHQHNHLFYQEYLVSPKPASFTPSSPFVPMSPLSRFCPKRGRESKTQCIRV